MAANPPCHFTSRSTSSEKGAALVIVLVVMLIGVGLSFYISRAAKGTVDSAFMLEDKLKAKLEAESQLELMRFLLATSRFENSRVAPIDSPPGFALPESFSLSGVPIDLGQSRISLRDTASMLSVPWGEPELVQRFLITQGVSREKAVRVADTWRDWLDQDEFKHLNGAERFDYIQRGIRAWTPRNSRAMQDKEEAGLIDGLQLPELWKKVAPELVWTKRGGRNIHTASEPMLQALLDISPEQAALLARRREEMGQLSQQDFLQVGGNMIGPANLAIAGFPNLTVVVQIRTSVGRAKEQIDAVLDFLPREEWPVTLLRYEQ